MNAKYMGKQLKFLTPKHSYTILFTKQEYTYECHVIYDITAQEDMDKYIQYASEISVKNHWKIDGNILDNE